MSLAPIVIELDTAQERISRNRAVVLGQGSYESAGAERAPGYNPQLSSNAKASPVTFTGMLTPAPQLAAWHTGGAGINTRLRKSDYTLTSASWDESTRSHSADYWLERKGAVEAVITTGTFAKNTPMWLSWFGYNSGVEGFVQMECGYNSTATLAGGVGFRFYSDGTVEVHKDGVQVAQYELVSGDAKTLLANKAIGVCIIPMRGREILVWANTGQAFVHVDSSIDEDDTNPTITPATKFWWKIVNGSATVQCAQIKYPTTGYLVTRLLALPVAVEAGATQATPDIRYKPAYYGTETAPTVTILESDGVTTFVPDGIKQQVRLKFALTGDGTNTPFLLGGLAGYAALFEMTDDSEAVDLLDHVTEAFLEVPDSPSGTSLTFRLTDPGAILATGLETQSNRPIQLRLGDHVLFDGRTGPARVERGMHEEIDHLEIEARDQWAALERYMWLDIIPLDSVTLANAIEFVALIAPIDTDMSDLDLTLPENIGMACGEWGLQIEAGDNAAQWITQLHEDYAAQCMMAIKPRAGGLLPVLWIKTPTDYEAQEVDVTLYGTTAAAIAGGITERYQDHVYQSYDEVTLAPEANDIRVTGWDPRLQQPIQSHYQDVASQDVGGPPSARATNWVGEPGTYVLFEPGISTQDVCDEVTRRLAARLTKPRRMAQWGAQMQYQLSGVPTWRGDLVYLDGVGVFVVTSLAVQFAKEPGVDDSPTMTWRARHATYTGEFVRLEP